MMCSSGNEFHLDATIGCPFGVGLALVWSRSVQSQNLRVAEVLGPCGLKQSNFHLSGLILDFAVDLVATEFAQDGEDSTFLLVLSDVERVNGHSVVEVGPLALISVELLQCIVDL